MFLQLTKPVLQFSAVLVCVFALHSCTSDSGKKSNGVSKKLFSSVQATNSGVTFSNNVVQNEDMNFFTNQHVLNGGGVAVGDLNNDGLPELYFTSNQNSNKIYLNKGGLEFEDVTEQTKAQGNSYWTMGVSIVDINADGWNDIYVCHAGNYLEEPEKLRNELFINNGDAQKNNGVPTFTERAEEFGLDGSSRSVQASFVDFDNDNDLDVYVLNHPYNFWLPVDMRVSAEQALPDQDSDRLYRNDGNNTFTDVTEEAGVKNWAFGLSASIGDLNNDGWMDIYVANDYSEKDECLINNRDGTFTKSIDSMFFHISNFSMGSDIADFNNDGLSDVVVVDMMAEDNRRKKINMSAMKPEVFWDNVALGRHYQYMQNTLQLNNGNGTFSDVAELSGVAFTDWSWSAILADLDNDGWKDLFISNGLAQDVRNTDANKSLLGKDVLELRENFQEHLSKLPSEPIDNYAFQNNGDLTFAKKTQEWGLDYKGFSNGAAVADLDRDGDLDVVLNNLNDTAAIFENTSEASNFLQISPKGPTGNQMGIGMVAKVYSNNGFQTQHVSISRGFLSCGESLLHFGLPSATVDSVVITWPSGMAQKFTNVKTNSLITVDYKDAIPRLNKPSSDQPLMNQLEGNAGIAFTHREKLYNDYNLEVLLPHKYSQLGPALCVGDVNGDGLEDLFLGGAAGFSGELYVQQSDGQFALSQTHPWNEHRSSEDVGSLFFDADGDGDLDLYVASGSNEWPRQSLEYLDRLYINNLGKFEYERNALPELYTSTACVKANDFDGDGDVDLFVGGRLIPAAYPVPAESVLLENINGIFKDVTDAKAPILRTLGMITDAEWFDFDNDGFDDLVISGEWMPITVLKNSNGQFDDATDRVGTSKHVGWWQRLYKVDIDADGDLDLIAGNLGLNTKYQGSAEEPFEVYYNDFDQNGSGDIVLGYAQQGAIYPVRGRSCSSEQVPSLKIQFPTYEEFGSATLEEVYGRALENSLNYKANWFSTSVLRNNGDGTFAVEALPNECQVSATTAIASLDVNSDGHQDLILSGNMCNAETETCRHDASIGQLMLGNSNGVFEFVPWRKSGLSVVGDTKQLASIKSAGGKQLLIFGINNQSPVIYSVEGK